MSDVPRDYGALPGRREAPAVRRLAQVAEQLGDRLRRRLVFIGASLLPLMETEEHVLSGSRAADLWTINHAVETDLPPPDRNWQAKWLLPIRT